MRSVPSSPAPSPEDPGNMTADWSSASGNNGWLRSQNSTQDEEGKKSFERQKLHLMQEAGGAAQTYQTRPSGTGGCPGTAEASGGGDDACAHNLASWGRYWTPREQRHWRDLSRVSLHDEEWAGPKVRRGRSQRMRGQVRRCAGLGHSKHWRLEAL